MKLLQVPGPKANVPRVMLITSNAVMRMGLNMTLKEYPSITVIDHGSAGFKAADVAVREKPEVILLDLELSDADPLALIRALRSTAADSHILVLSGVNDAKLTLKALAAGAEGVVLNIQPPAVLFAAIESLFNGVPRSLSDQVVQPVNRLISMPSTRTIESKGHGFIETLTDREREVIHLLAKGFKNKDVADRLCISESTVRHHLTSIFSKLHVSTRLQLLITAHQQGLIELSAG